MAEFTKETIRTQGNTGDTVVNAPVKTLVSKTQTTENVIYFIFGLLEVLLAFRLVLKLTGASTASGFVRLMYSLTAIFILPFEGIFHRAVAQGIETASVFEPSTLVAMIVYILLAWGVVKVVRIASGEAETA